MHMGNELLTLPVAGACFAAAGVGVGWASAKARATLDERRTPLLGVLGAFVFAAQMVNFPVLPGTTGHFVGGALLAVVLGAPAAVLGMAAIVIVQCLVFQDGGLLALGANLLNMAVVGPVLAAAVFRAVAGRGPDASAARFYGAAFLASLAAVVGGAALVPVQVALSGVSRIPFGTFLSAMLGVHVLIGAAEGLLTFAALLALARLRPGLLPGRRAVAQGFPLRTALASILGAALVVGALLSHAAASAPDGLEATVEARQVLAEGAENPAADTADRWGERLAIFPDYNRPAERWYWRTVSGVLGLLLVLALVLGVARAVRGRPGRTADGAA